MKKAHEQSHHRFAGSRRHSLRGGFNGFLRALPGEPGFVATIICKRRLANLTPASGCQDHTTSPSASSSARLASPKRPPHSDPNVRDDRDTPLLRGRNGAFVKLIWVKHKPKSFFNRDWTASIGLIRFDKSAGRRMVLSKAMGIA